MRISPNVLELVAALRSAIEQDGEGNLSSVMAQELSQLPDFENSRATAGYRITPEGDIVDDHWWLVMDDDSVFDASDEEPTQCSKKDSRHGHYFPYTGETGIPMEVLQMADHLRAASRTANNKSFSEMVGEASGASAPSGVARQAPEAMPDAMTVGGQEGVAAEPFDDEVRPEDMQTGNIGDLKWDDLVDEDTNEAATAYVQPEEGVTQQELALIEQYADRLFSKVGIDVAFTRHFRARVNDPRNEKIITSAELVRLFKQEYRKHGKSIARLGPDAEAILRDMATDINVPFVLKWDARDGHLDLVAKTVMRKPNFGSGDDVFAVEDGTDVNEVDHPEYMPGGEGGGTDNYDPTYDERATQVNPGHPRP